MPNAKLNQTNLLKNLSKYFYSKAEEYKAEGVKYDHDFAYEFGYDGFCAAFVILWAFAMWVSSQSFNNNSESDNKSDNIRWFKETLELISKLDDAHIKTLNKESSFNIERLAALLMFCQNVVFFNDPNDGFAKFIKLSDDWGPNLQIDKYLEYCKGITIRKPHLKEQTDGFFTPQELIEFLKERINYENVPVFTGICNHAVAIINIRKGRSIEDGYYFYDPNNNNGWECVDSVEELAKLIRENPCRIEIKSLTKKEFEDFKKCQLELFKENIQRICLVLCDGKYHITVRGDTNDELRDIVIEDSELLSKLEPLVTKYNNDNFPYEKEIETVQLLMEFLNYDIEPIYLGFRVVDFNGYEQDNEFHPKLDGNNDAEKDGLSPLTQSLIEHNADFAPKF